ncbi:SubName: Full=Uncharacterized protein {ECO:0000313/EMBL:CCA76007.1} [Serendipita indica DSM 11827]|nr:SubName: Full=Uncharacterized protein {ECO:0000313/EMBL:CCA76007.1} [Serendipita indica DSM 11827]
MNLFEATKPLNNRQSVSISDYFFLNNSDTPTHLANCTFHVLPPKQEYKITVPPLARHFVFMLYGSGSIYHLSGGKDLEQWDCFAYAPVKGNGEKHSERSYTLVGGKEGGGVLILNDSLNVNKGDIDPSPPESPTIVSSYEVTTWSGSGVETKKKATLTGLSDLARPLRNFTRTPNPESPPPLPWNATLEVLLPGTQTSFPHAHSTEDELVIVLAGKARYWCDGEEPEMTLVAGDVVAWKAGTGLCHAILNDGDGPGGSGSNVVLLTIGENKPETDKLFYPTKLKHRRHEHWWWKDVPQHSIGGASDTPHYPRTQDMEYPTWETKARKKYVRSDEDMEL